MSKEVEVTKCPTVILVKSPNVTVKLSKLERELLAQHRKELKKHKPRKQLGKSYYNILQVVLPWLMLNSC